jgi:hypothetical protein
MFAMPSTYDLNADQCLVLTPFGRQQLCEYGATNLGSNLLNSMTVDLGVTMRLKYGFLLKVYNIPPGFL